MMEENTIRKFRWVAHYSDDTILKEVDGETKNSYESIDREKLVAFSLYTDDYESKIFTIHLEPSQRLIWRRREYLKLGSPSLTVHLVGWQQTVKGENIQSIIYLFPDGRIELAGKWKEGHPLFDKVELLNIET